MKYVILIIIICSVAYFGYQKMYQNPFVGNWKSNKELTASKLKEDGMDSGKIVILKRMLGKMTYTITQDKWTISLNDQTNVSSYKILSSNDNCHTIQFDEGAKKVVQEICIEDNNMYVPIARLNGKEVFSKVN